MGEINVAEVRPVQSHLVKVHPAEMCISRTAAYPAEVRSVTVLPHFGEKDLVRVMMQRIAGNTPLITYLVSVDIGRHRTS